WDRASCRRTRRGGGDGLKRQRSVQSHVDGRRRATAVFVEPQLPAAAEGAVDVDQVQGDVALGDGELVLLLHLRRFQVEDGVEGDGADAVLVPPNAKGL